MTGDVLDDDDGVVNNEARTDGESHEREIVQAVVTQIHHAESADEGKRDGDTGDNGGPNIPEECEDHENHKDDGNDERDFHVMDRGANRGGAVNGDAQMERRRNGSAEQWKEGGDAVHRLDHVGAGLAEDGEENRALPAGEAESADVLN